MNQFEPSVIFKKANISLVSKKRDRNSKESYCSDIILSNAWKVLERLALLR